MKTILQAMYGSLLLLTPFCCGQQDMTPVEVTLCGLYQHPEEYAGKMVKVRAGSVGDLRLENILHDSPAEPCPSYMRLFVALPYQVKPTPSFQLVRNESFKELERALHRGGAIHIDATYEGRFDPAFVWRDHKRIRVGQDEEKGYGKKHEYDGRIVLRRVSDVWAEPLPQK
jgi:hypothetical protein